MTDPTRKKILAFKDPTKEKLSAFKDPTKEKLSAFKDPTKAKIEPKTEKPTPSKNFCIDCGKELELGSKFCNNCGTKQP
ncbi:MAG: zinc ribbon domain-containing protein [Candidatus Bathyarchaeia archaeon]